MKKKIALLIGLMMFSTLGFTACGERKDSNKKNDTAVVNTKEGNKELKKISFIDDLGTEIVLEQPAKKIISLYSGHTENLFALGLNKEIIGVSTSDKYPKEVEGKEQFSSEDGVEKIIAAKPEVVLFRTSVAKAQKNELVKSLQSAGIKVVALYVDEYDKFDGYIKKIGLLTGKEKEADEKLKEFHNNINKIKEKASTVKEKKTVYFESMGKNFKTVTPNSFAGKAIELIGAKNIASDLRESKDSTTVVEYGEEKLLSIGKDIDIYVAQKGVMNKDVSIKEIKTRPGYEKIKAVQNDAIIIVDEKLISAATFRYAEGIKELQEKIYH